jgi:hypothetical protein
MTPSLCLHTCSSHIYALKRTHPSTLLVRGGPTLQRRRVPIHIHGCHAHPRASSKEPPLLSANYYTQSTLDRKLQSASFPMDQDGRTYHVGTCLGEVSNRILGVGSIGRARLLGSLLSPLPGAITCTERHEHALHKIWCFLTSNLSFDCCLHFHKHLSKHCSPSRDVVSFECL